MWTYVKISYVNSKDGILLVKWIPCPSNDEDIQTNNLAGSDYEKHIETYTGKDDYSSMS